MEAALIGLGGVIVGALLGGLVTSLNEKEQRWAGARGAALLIGEELTDITTRMASAVSAHTYWSEDLPSAAWSENRQALAELTTRYPGLLTRLSSAYALAATWNTMASAGTGLDVAKLEADRGSIEADRKYLEHTLESPPRRAFRALNTVGGWVLPALVALSVVIGIVAVVPSRPYVTAQSVGDSLERVMAEDNVDCDPANGDWRCVSTRFVRTRASCPHRRSLVAVAAGGMQFAKTQAQVHTCPVQTVYDVERDGDQLLATPKSSTEYEQEAIRHRRAMPVPEKSLWTRFWDGVSGKN